MNQRKLLDEGTRVVLIRGSSVGKTEEVLNVLAEQFPDRIYVEGPYRPVLYGKKQLGVPTGIVK